MKRSGFTIVEMAIVLTVVALLIGGIVVGQNLLRASQLRSVSSDFSRYTQAMSDFKDKYGMLPGDMSNAESFWGTDTAPCATTAYNTVLKVATCNGDGDGTIEFNGEVYRAWQHLANANLIEGSFTGAFTGAPGSYAVPGVTTPKSQVDGGTFTVFWYSTADTGNWWASTAHHIGFGAPRSGTWGYGPILTPAEAHDIDAKLDDGVPSTGKVITIKPSLLTGCATSNTAASAEYSTSSSILCMLIYVTEL